jgi:DNA polymerase-4
MRGPPLSSFTPADIRQAVRRTVVHVDMDAFYAAVEQHDNPELVGRPVVVGADPRGGRGRGVVSAASYEARPFGIHSALPISTAWRRCPHAVYLRPRFSRYRAVSRRVMDILEKFSPLVEQISIDEAFLDCSGTEKLFGEDGDLGRSIKDAIRGETGLTASVGIASNKSVAKIATELGKPDGLMVCPRGGEGEFLAPLPLGYLWGAGRKTVDTLARHGFRTIGDVARCPLAWLSRIFGKYGTRLWELANGIDPRSVHSSSYRKSISEEITFDSDTDDTEMLEGMLFSIADRLTRRMRRESIRGRTVTLKIRLTGFETHTRSRTLGAAVDGMERVRDTALALFREFDRSGRRVRLIGIGVSNLIGTEKGQLELFDGGDAERSRRTQDLLDRMKDLYGEKVIRASFLPDS